MRGARPSFLRERGPFCGRLPGGRAVRNSPEGGTCRQTGGCPGIVFFACFVKRGSFDPARRTSKALGMKRASAGRKPFLCRGAYEKRSGQWLVCRCVADVSVRRGAAGRGLYLAAARLSLREWAVAGAGECTVRAPCGQRILFGARGASAHLRKEGLRPQRRKARQARGRNAPELLRSGNSRRNVFFFLPNGGNGGIFRLLDP